MQPCKKCERPAQLIATNEQQEVLTQSDSLGRVVLRRCPVYIHDDYCYYCRKIRDGLIQRGFI